MNSAEKAPEYPDTYLQFWYKRTGSNRILREKKEYYFF
jgi:hypothetical protein